MATSQANTMRSPFSRCLLYSLSLLILVLFAGSLEAQTTRSNNAGGCFQNNHPGANQTVDFTGDFGGGATVDSVVVILNFSTEFGSCVPAGGAALNGEIGFAITNNVTGTRVPLIFDDQNCIQNGASSTFNGFTGALNASLRLTEGSSIPVGPNPVPTTGTYNPEGNLASFVGENPEGVWTLQIVEVTSGSNLIMNSWSVEIYTAAACAIGSISSNPSNTSVCAGETAQFSIGTTGQVDSIRWFQAPGTLLANGGNVSGANSSTLTLSNVNPGMNGNQYFARIYACAPVSSAMSSSAALTVIPNDPPNITSDPANTSACSGDLFSFTVGATGTGLTYQWQRFEGGAFVDLPGATSATYSATAINLHHNRQYRCIVNGTCTPPDTSAAATLSVTAGPVLSVMRANNTGGCFQNQSVSQTVDFTGTTGGNTVDSVVISIEFSTHFTSCVHHFHRVNASKWRSGL